MRKLFLHIGQHKTGTKSLQRFFATNRQVLYQEGIIYPDFLGMPPCHHFARYYGFGIKTNTVEENNEVERVIKTIKNDAISKNKNIVISSEIMFSNVSADKLQKIKNEFKHFEIKVICFLRRQDTYAESHYRQMIKMGHTYTFDEYLQISSFDWNVQLEIYEKVFSVNNIKIIPFEDETFQDCDIYDLFLDIIHIKKKSKFVKLTEYINVSFSNEITEVIRLYNMYFSQIEIFDKDKILLMFTEYVSSNRVSIGNYDYFTSKDRLEFLEKYATSNASLSLKFSCENPFIFKYNQVSIKNESDIELCSFDKMLYILMDILLKK